MENMEQESPMKNIVNGAMMYGTWMGIYWMLKFMLVPLMFTVPLASLLFLGLTAAVPFVGYFFVRHFRERYCLEGRIAFVQAWMFTLLMYAFAALLASVVHYVYFAYVDGGALLGTYVEQLDLLGQLQPELAEAVAEYKKAAELLVAMSPIDLTVQMIVNNLFYGMILALPTALVASMWRRKREKIKE